MANLIVRFLALAVVAALFGACNRSNHIDEDAHSCETSLNASTEHEHEQDGEEKAEAAHSEGIIFTPEQASACKLEMEEVKPADFQQVIKTSGQVLSASDNEVTIVSSINGVIDFSKSVMTEGVGIAAGQLVATVSARKMAEGDPLVKAEAEYEAARLEYERNRGLVADKIISAREFEQSKLQYEKTKTAYEALSGSGSSAGIRIQSPMSGFVKSRLVGQGEYVSVGQPLMVLTKNRRLQLRADVLEKYFNKLKGVHGANFKLAYGDSVFRLSSLNGRLLSFGKTTSENSSFVPVIFEFDNVGDVVPGSFAEVYLLSTLRKNVISVPKASLMESQGIYYVFVNVDEEGYRRQEVKLGQSDGCRVEILAGLNPGDRVVTHGAMQIRLASASAAIPAHSHQH